MFPLSNKMQGNTLIRTTKDLLAFIGLTSLNSNAFQYCYELREIILPSNIHTLGGQCFNGSLGYITELTLPYITKVGNWCFTNRSVKSGYISALTKIHLGDVNMTNSSGSGYGPFQNNPLKLIEFSAGTVSIIANGNNQIFGYIEKTTSSNPVKIVIHAVNPPALSQGTSNFTSTSYYTIYVPDNSVDTYKAASYWSEVASHIKPLSSYPNPSELLYLE